MIVNIVECRSDMGAVVPSVLVAMTSDRCAAGFVASGGAMGSGYKSRFGGAVGSG